MSLKKNMTNAELADLFRAVAAVYAIQGVEIFRTKAYINAAASIEQFPTPLKDMWEADQIGEVPGIGEKFGEYLDEYFKTGRIKRLEKTLSTEPEGMYPLLEVPGIGPKTAVKLANLLNLRDATTAVSIVQKAAQTKELEKLEGFSEVTQNKILQSIEQFLKPREHRLLLSEAEEIASDVISYLRKSPLTMDAEVLGSLRRRAPTVGDIDIAVMTEDSTALQEYILKFPHIQRVLSTGLKTTMFIHKSGWQVDVKNQEPERWGSMLQHYTGSKLHNIHLRTLAMAKGLSLSENGIKKAEETATYKDEKTFYNALGLQYIPPELREDNGEIEAAKKKAIPDLVELSDISGDFHMHTNVDFPSSHDSGAGSISDLLAKAQSLGYSYIGFTDHNPKQSGMTASERVVAVRKRNESIDLEVEKFTQKSSGKVPKVYKGLEVDILPTGKLALEDEALELLDYAIVSIHSAFHPNAVGKDVKEVRELMTQRILTALAHPRAKILGHPTARIIPDRPEIECDWDQIFEYVSKNNKFIEINSSPDRLDLPSPLVQRALEFGVQFVINTDAHNVESLDLMKYGVWTARKGWATAKNVANARKESFL